MSENDELNELDLLANNEQSEKRATESVTDFEPDEPVDESAKENAEAGAAMLVGVIDGALHLAMPALVITDEQKAKVTEKLSPVIMKYSGGSVPPWLASYQEELELAASVGLVAFSVYSQYKLAKTQPINDETESHGSEPEPETPKQSRNILGALGRG